MEHKQPATPEEQPEIPTQTGDVHVRDKEVEKSRTTEEDTMNKLMEMFMQMSKKMDAIGDTNKNLESKMEGVNKKLDSTTEENNKKMEESNKKMEENLSKKMDSTEENLHKKMDDNNHSTKEELNEINKNIESTKEELRKDLSLIHIFHFLFHLLTGFLNFLIGPLFLPYEILSLIHI